MLPKIVIIFLSSLAASEALRVLVVFPVTSKSHSILGHGVVNRLLEAGHEVVHLTGIPREKSEKSLKEIAVANFMLRIAAEDPDNARSFALKDMVGQPNFGDSVFFLNFTFNYHRLFLEDKNVHKFLSNPKEKFDAVILEWFFADFIAGIAPLFQCPLIWLGSTEAHWQVLKLVDSYPNPAYNVDLFSPSTPPLTFWERAMELWIMLKKSVMINFLITSKEKEVYEKVFASIATKRGVPLPSYEEAVYNGSLLLLNSHPSFGTPFSLPQNAKYIGGYHIDDKVAPLHEDLKELMDNAKHGVIFFSMGSNLKSADMSAYMKDSLLRMFGKLKQTVIWKFEEELENVPANIHLVKWAPQQSIFAHPNLKFFITHGGQLSTTEAIHYAVPVIGIPVFGDQFINMDSVARKGFGIKLQLAENIAEQLIVAIEQMLSNPLYKERAIQLSQIYHDRPLTPGKELVHWVEHVTRTRGAPHLRSPALMLPWYQKLYLDLLALIFTIVYLVINSIKGVSKKKTHVAKKKRSDTNFTLAYVMEHPEQTNDIRYLQDTAYKVALATFENDAVQKLLVDRNEHFDVVIVDLYETELYAALAALLKCPMIWSYSMGAHWMTLRLLDEVTNPAFATDYLSADLPSFDFSSRLNKLWLQIQWSYIKWAETLPKEEAVYKKFFEAPFSLRGEALPNYQDIMYNASLVLANDYKGNGLIPSTPQNFVFVGGFHVQTPPKSFPKDIQTILDNAKHGFIYFSLGSMWQSKDLPKSVVDGILKVFGELKETVVWKFEEGLSDLPKNVHVLKWAPQTSILAHSNCLLFITHGGHLSSIETIHFGVPTIGIPIYFDQFININKAVFKGYAIKVDLSLHLPKDLKSAIRTMLDNSTYKEKAKELSQIYHDRVVPPGKELVHWVEHVVKARGALHLRSPALMLPWYQKMYLDLAGIIITIIIIILFVLKRMCSSRKVKLEKKRN